METDSFVYSHLLETSAVFVWHACWIMRIECKNELEFIESTRFNYMGTTKWTFCTHTHTHFLFRFIEFKRWGIYLITMRAHLQAAKVKQNHKYKMNGFICSSHCVYLATFKQNNVILKNKTLAFFSSFLAVFFRSVLENSIFSTCN